MKNKKCTSNVEIYIFLSSHSSFACSFLWRSFFELFMIVQKVSRVMTEAGCLNEVFIEVRRVHVIRSALPSPGWPPVLSLRWEADFYKIYTQYGQSYNVSSCNVPKEQRYISLCRFYTRVPSSTRLETDGHQSCDGNDYQIFHGTQQYFSNWLYPPWNLNV